VQYFTYLVKLATNKPIALFYGLQK
jgi:hypothetical protein